jgi:hypothetical protein
LQNIFDFDFPLLPPPQNAIAKKGHAGPRFLDYLVTWQSQFALSQLFQNVTMV